MKRHLSLWIATALMLCITPLSLLMQDAPPEVTPEPVAPEVAPIQDAIALQESLTQMLINARLDIESLADTMGVARPEGWSGSLDIENPQLVILIRLDLELLAGALWGGSTRPEGWFGVVSSTSYFIARDIRHDLELLAGTVLPPGERPAGWLGGMKILQCDRATQALAYFLEFNGVLSIQADPTAPDFCEQVTRAVSLFVELNYLGNPVPGALTATGIINAATVNSNFAVGFYDRATTRRAGVIPNGTFVQPVARSYAQFSKMMLVRGDGFELFVEFGFTTVDDETFNALPNVDDLDIAPFCDLSWCG